MPRASRLCRSAKTSTATRTCTTRSRPACRCPLDEGVSTYPHMSNTPMTLGEAAMRIAVISDIHGNDVAFAAVVADIQTDRIERIFCLGDAIQGGAQPAEVVKRLRELRCPVVMGNADDLLLRGEASANEEPPNEWINAVRDWQLQRLSPEDLAFIAAFPPTVEIPLPRGKRLLCGHGSPQHFNHVIVPDVADDEVKKMLGPIDEAIVCGGHTHLQQIRQIGTSFFFNPGSVSLPVRRD